MICPICNKELKAFSVGSSICFDMDQKGHDDLSFVFKDKNNFYFSTGARYVYSIKNGIVIVNNKDHVKMEQYLLTLNRLLKLQAFA